MKIKESLETENKILKIGIKYKYILIRMDKQTGRSYLLLPDADATELASSNSQLIRLVETGRHLFKHDCVISLIDCLSVGLI